MTYAEFIEHKTHLGGRHGFKPTFLPDCLFDFQKALVEWAVDKGRGALFEDCGLGKSLQQLVWAQNVVEHSNRPVLILTPLAVSHQTVREGQKFGVEAVQRRTGLRAGDKIVVTNYEKLHLFNWKDFSGVVCDESGILKNFDGATRAAVIEFMRKVPFRLLCSATPSPNDPIELGNSSEALGEMGFSDMLSMFFKKVEKTLSRKDEHRGGVYRLRGHAQHDFWRWVCSWARAVRKPSDLGFSDGKFLLPPLNIREHIVSAKTKGDGMLFDLPAANLWEQRDELKRTVQERCEMAAQLVNSHDKSALAWCHLNREGDLLAKLCKGATQVSGQDADERKEEVFQAFEDGQVRVLVSKPSIASLGLNFQHCAHQTYFPSHSYESAYQGIRRSWRFGQKNPVVVDYISTEGQADVLANLKRKSAAADHMFSRLVELMNDELKIQKDHSPSQSLTLPPFLCQPSSKPSRNASPSTMAIL